MRPFANFLIRSSAGLARVELLLCKLLIVGFAGLLLVNVAMRYLFSAPLYYAEELSVYILIWMSFLAIAATIARREMIALTFAVDVLPPALRRVMKIVVDLIVLCMVAALAWVSWRWINSIAMQFEMALTLGMAKRPFYAIVPIFFVLATFHTLANLAYHISGSRAHEGSNPERVA